MRFNQDKRQLFSYRKFKAYGLGSALLGMAVVGADGAVAKADELDLSTPTVTEVAEVAATTDTVETDSLILTADTPALTAVEAVTPTLAVEAPASASVVTSPALEEAAPSSAEQAVAPLLAPSFTNMAPSTTEPISWQNLMKPTSL